MIDKRGLAFYDWSEESGVMNCAPTWAEGEPTMIELNGETYLDGKEACHLLGVKVSTLYTYVSRGILRSYKQGIKRQRLYKQIEVESLLQLRPSTDASPGANNEQGGDEQEHGPDLPHAEDWVPNV